MLIAMGRDWSLYHWPVLLTFFKYRVYIGKDCKGF
jgi:hypothetical protein